MSATIDLASSQDNSGADADAWLLRVRHSMLIYGDRTEAERFDAVHDCGYAIGERAFPASSVGGRRARSR